MPRPFAILTVMAVVLASCAHVRPSRWEDASGKYVCVCDGTERNPTPSEAEDFRDGKTIEAFCDGNVHDCGTGGRCRDYGNTRMCD